MEQLMQENTVLTEQLQTKMFQFGTNPKSSIAQITDDNTNTRMVSLAGAQSSINENVKI